MDFCLFLSSYIPSVQASRQAAMEYLDMDYSNSVVVVVTFEVVFLDVAGFLESVDLLACIYVSKAVCSAAGKRLNVIESNSGK